jgi:hypothetical protein
MQVLNKRLLHSHIWNPSPPYYLHSHLQLRRFEARSSRRWPSRSSATIVSITTSATENPATTISPNRSSPAPRPFFSNLPPLSLLPFGVLLRSYLIASLSASSVLLPFFLRVLSRVASSESLLLDPDHHLFLRYLLKKTFYAHFCAGEDRDQVKGVVDALKRLGYGGVILTYAKEVLQHRSGTYHLTAQIQDDGGAKSEIESWKRGSLETIRMVGEGDLVALK